MNILKKIDTYLNEKSPDIMPPDSDKHAIEIMGVLKSYIKDNYSDFKALTPEDEDVMVAKIRDIIKGNF